jgi:membrane-bound metal-dependent hydrolase YbcI (DUF457 family)
MFAGHLAAALAAKTATRQVPLSWLVAAAFGLDLLWPIFLIAGFESVRIDPGNTAFTPLAFDHYPWSHSLILALFWAALTAMAAVFRVGPRLWPALTVGAVVVSHWLLDFVTHRPDLPLWPGGATVGLGLWNSIPATFIVEGAIFAAAIALYSRAFPPSDAAGRWSFRLLVGFVALVWITGPFSPPPPNATAIAVVGLAMWLFPVWAGWIERHRREIH